MSGSPESLMCEDVPIVNPIILTELKKCPVCKKINPIEDFYIDKSKRDKLSYSCKKCTKIRTSQWQKNNLQKRKIICKKWDLKNKEKKLAYFKYYQKKNSIKCAEKSKKWRRNNLQKARKIMNDYCKRKRNTIKGKLELNIKSSIYRSLKGNKNNHWNILVGYNVDQLKKHLEKQFKDGMTWENYGKWHIDHIVPVSVHNFNSPEDIDFKRCWSLNNLQPMWGKDNISKKDKLIKPFQPSLALG